jgi:hypothetical protein
MVDKFKSAAGVTSPLGSKNSQPAGVTTGLLVNQTQSRRVTKSTRLFS